MRVDQAIYTSLPRAGKDGYHVVSRSRGVSEADARALSAWSPSHDALIVDEANRISVNVHPLTDGRLAISRTCEGRPEYSGRGGRQVYTHAIILAIDDLRRSGTQPIALYRDALAQGVLRYRPSPPPILEEVELGRCHRFLRRPDAGAPDPNALNDLHDRLRSGDRLELRLSGDRVHFAECLLESLPRELLLQTSLSTSLRPSSARPFRVCLVPRDR
ncbi:GAP1-N2 domain-containing protein [Tautonia sociabilis]|uniref:GTPase-associated protein 1 N-terminal domain-containing protein n=1 Tax=Tautonia sociabilis TaxID=2080755 RepID=A0A432MCQ1_9BACT|nr:hypothetical protein [Tautonia sociabilis]RUL81995.1 hypothetical protein TsocGM_24125 [Tautonia sociabilis]